MRNFYKIKFLNFDQNFNLKPKIGECAFRKFLLHKFVFCCMD